MQNSDLEDFDDFDEVDPYEGTDYDLGEAFYPPGACMLEGCIMPGFHSADECHTSEMLESYYAELAKT